MATARDMEGDSMDRTIGSIRMQTLHTLMSNARERMEGTSAHETNTKCGLLTIVHHIVFLLCNVRGFESYNETRVN
jgi:hypothetical protein